MSHLYSCIAKASSFYVQDPRRMDPRLVAVTNGEQTTKSESTTSELQSRDAYFSSAGVSLVNEVGKVENPSETEILENLKTPSIGAPSVVTPEEDMVIESSYEVHAPSCEAVSPEDVTDQEQAPSSSSDDIEDETEDFSLFGVNQLSAEVISEEVTHDLPILPSYVDLSDKDHEEVSKAVIQRIVEAYKNNRATGSGHIRQAILAHLIALVLSSVLISFFHSVLCGSFLS